MAPSFTASTLYGDVRGGWMPSSPDEASSTTRCSTKYAASSLPWVSTDYYTSTSYAYRSRTELLTPKPSTTSVSATSTYTEYETAPNNLTKTVYTDTYTWTDYQTQYETVIVTSTVTESVLHTATIPTQAGFTPVAAVYPEASHHIDEYADQDQWSVEDSYSQEDEPEVPQEPELPVLYLDTLQSAESEASASKVDCLVTLINVYYQGTTSSKLYITPPTYTRTKYVATVTTTSTVRTKIAPSDRTATTVTMASDVAITSWYTETQTSFATTTTTAYPNTTTSIYAACATSNIIDTYESWPLASLADDWSKKNYTLIHSDWNEISNETSCSEGGYNSYGGGYNNSDEAEVPKINVPVWYEPRDRGWYGFTVGNGPRGRISFSSLWE
ncbi:hypothetical protein N0V83_004510 [Neocucurbitaria cava]|uniref:Uncharacterized protein n=1 Tax=Neocucurbitaria cava TaxID=798079 RepID=A0A9W9CMJ4_9PLEO|nr:hypothetical protein N0V83_004510 [Neocucurbitaria cava]